MSKSPSISCPLFTIFDTKSQKCIYPSSNPKLVCKKNSTLDSKSKCISIISRTNPKLTCPTDANLDSISKKCISLSSSTKSNPTLTCPKNTKLNYESKKCISTISTSNPTLTCPNTTRLNKESKKCHTEVCQCDSHEIGKCNKLDIVSANSKVIKLNDKYIKDNTFDETGFQRVAWVDTKLSKCSTLPTSYYTSKKNEVSVLDNSTPIPETTDNANLNDDFREPVDTSLPNADTIAGELVNAESTLGVPNY